MVIAGRAVKGLAMAAAAMLLPSLARADLQLCNRTSYAVETAVGLEEKSAVATRGWFRLDPGQCRVVLQGDLVADHVYMHARALPVYGASPLPQTGHADLCVAQGNFVIAAARTCRSGQTPARFTSIIPSETEKGLTAYLSEEAEYSDEQAREAGIQRILVIAGYDANPIDGIRGAKTEAALTAFLQDNALPTAAGAQSSFFDTLIEAAQKPGVGFAWCNETAQMVMAALGSEENGGIVTRGWYRVEPGKCVKPDVRGVRKRLYSFAEAIDTNGMAVRTGGKPLSWGGARTLCTRDVKFEISEHTDCVSAGLTPSGFAAVDVNPRGGTTVRFKMP